MLRTILAVIFGVVLAGVIVSCAEALDVALFPSAAAVPSGSDPARWAAYMAGLPLTVLSAVVAGSPGYGDK